MIVATGARSAVPALEGGDDAHVLDAWEVIAGRANVGASVVIADWRGDWVGLGLAEKLARDGCRVTLAVNGATAGETIQPIVRDIWYGELHKLGVQVVPYARLFGADATTVYMQHSVSGEPMIFEDIDTLVTAHACRPGGGPPPRAGGLRGNGHRHRRLPVAPHRGGGDPRGLEGGLRHLTGRPRPGIESAHLSDRE